MVRACRHVIHGALFLTLFTIASIEFYALHSLTGGDVSQLSGALALDRPTTTADDVISKKRRKRKRRTSLANNYQSPVDSMLNGFSNDAMEREIHKHDRWVVDSQAFLHTFDADKYQAASTTTEQTKLMTIIILTINRSVPYVSVALSTLIRGHTPETFRKYIDLHVVNIERRPDRTPNTYFADLERKLGSFFRFWDWSEHYKETEHIRKMNKPEVLYMEDQRIDVIRSLKLCKERNSAWCLSVEDDAVFPVGFAPTFDRYINVERYENATLPGGAKQNYDSPPLKAGEDNSTGPVMFGRLGFIKLYVPYNDGLADGLGKGKSGGNIKAAEYSLDDYHSERALDLYEESTLENAKVDYRVKASWTMYGGVANAYPKDKLDMLISYLSNTKRFKNYPTDTLLNFDFIVGTKLALLETHPSMVGHIGYYRENLDAGKGIGEISTDIRFKLDDGQGLEAKGEASTKTGKLIGKSNTGNTLVVSYK